VPERREPGSIQPVPRAGGHFEMSSQAAEVINNVLGDQRIEYVWRVAAMRRRARQLLRAGLLVIFAGALVYLAVFFLFGREILDLINAVWDASATGTEPELPEASFAPLAALPIAFLLWLTGLGMVASSLLMKRRAHRAERQR
jgi:hypothetical protein